MLASECQFQPSAKCVTAVQTEITERMRVMLVAWMVEVHLKFKLMPETLFITVNMIDRFCEMIPVKRNEY